MKYLKLFETTSDPLYTELSISEYESYFCEMIPFGENELQKILDIPNSIDMGFSSTKWIGEIVMNMNNQPLIIFKLGVNKLFVRKILDDWYIVGSNDHCYKCDQLDGLTQCLKYEMSIYY